MSGKWDRLMSDRARRVVTFVAWVSLLATVGAWLYGSSSATPPTRDVDSFGSGPIGHRAWVETLEELGIGTSRKRTAYRWVVPEPTVFLEPSRRTVEIGGWTQHFSDVIDQREEEGAKSLVVLPKWRMAGGVARLVPAGEVDSLLQSVTSNLDARVQRHPGEGEATVHETTGALGSFRIEVPVLQTLLETGCEAVVVYADAGPVVAQCGTTFVLSDPDVLHNFNVHRQDHAALTAALVRGALGDRVVVDEVFHGHGAQSGLGTALGEFPTVLLVVHLLLLGTLVMLTGMRRFGAPRRRAAVFERGPRRIIEVAATVLASGTKPPVLVVNYIKHVVRDTAELFGNEPEEDVHRAAARIDEIAGRFGVPSAAVHALATAEALADRSKGKALGPSLSAARSVWRLRRDLQRTVTGRR